MKRKSDVYNDAFYQERYRKTRYAARKILEIVASIMEINSAVDIGCGVGTWLKEVKNINGKASVLGIDGEYVNKKYFQIDKNEFLAAELEKRIRISKRYDLAISLEVAEHLSPLRADSFIDDLCRMSDVILFSAATRCQRGDAHVNEQRCSYWVKLFQKKGYIPFDVIRPVIWYDEKIPIWYRQNTILYINEKVVYKFSPKLNCNYHIYDMIHPQNYENAIMINQKYEASFVYKMMRKIEQFKTKHRNYMNR